MLSQALPRQADTTQASGALALGVVPGGGRPPPPPTAPPSVTSPCPARSAGTLETSGAPLTWPHSPAAAHAPRRRAFPPRPSTPASTQLARCPAGQLHAEWPRPLPSSGPQGAARSFMDHAQGADRPGRAAGRRHGRASRCGQGGWRGLERPGDGRLLGGAR